MGWGGITSTHRHYNPLIKTPRSSDSREVDVVRVDSCLEEGIGHVQFPKDFSPCAVSKNVVHAWQGEVVSYGVHVQFSVIIHPTGWYGQIRNAITVFWDTKRRWGVFWWVGNVTGFVTRAGRCDGLWRVRVRVGKFVPLKNPYPWRRLCGYSSQLIFQYLLYIFEVLLPYFLSFFNFYSTSKFELLMYCITETSRYFQIRRFQPSQVIVE